MSRRLVASVVALLALTARAEGSATAARCRALRAEAQATSSLLYYPQLEAQLLHVPRGGDLHPGTLPEGGTQARAGLAFSPLDVARGRTVVGAAEAECSRHLAQEVIVRTLRHGTSFGRAGALRKQIAALEASLSRAAELTDDAQQRVARQLASVFELDEVRLRRARLERRLGDARHELAMLEAQEPAGAPELQLHEAVSRYDGASLLLERERSFLRTLSAWQVDLRAGLVPGVQTDWYGMISVGYKLGGIGQLAAERELLAARAAELKSSDAELRVQVERFLATMRESAAALREELAMIDRQLAVYRERAQLDGRDSDGLRQRLAVLELDRLELESHRAYVESLLEQRERAVGER